MKPRLRRGFFFCARRVEPAQRYREWFGVDAPTEFRAVRVHDYDIRFGRRLRAAGVNLEDRRDLPGGSYGPGDRKCLKVNGGKEGLEPAEGLNRISNLRKPLEFRPPQIP